MGNFGRRKEDRYNLKVDAYLKIYNAPGAPVESYESFYTIRNICAGGAYLDTGDPLRELRAKARQESEPADPEPVVGPVGHEGVQPAIAQGDLEDAARGRVPLLCGPDIAGQTLEHWYRLLPAGMGSGFELWCACAELC